jgi:hypothetical protein
VKAQGETWYARTMETHINSRYEYITREFPTVLGEVTPGFEAELDRDGWRRVWASITMEGTFAVYRRDRRAADDGCKRRVTPGRV